MQLYTEQVKRTKRVPPVHVVGEPPLLVASKGVLHIIPVLIINNITIYAYIALFYYYTLYALDEMIYTTMIIIMIITIMIRSHVRRRKTACNGNALKQLWLDLRRHDNIWCIMYIII